jgi:hypothetical protein
MFPSKLPTAICLLCARQHLQVSPILFLHDGRNTNGQFQLRKLDAAHGEHHQHQHAVGAGFFTNGKAHGLIAAGIAMLVLSSIIIGSGTYLKGEQEKASKQAAEQKR